MNKRKARLKKVTGGTIVEIYSSQQKKWYCITSEPMPRPDAHQLCRIEGYEIVRSE